MPEAQAVLTGLASTGGSLGWAARPRSRRRRASCPPAPAPPAAARILPRDFQGTTAEARHQTLFHSDFSTRM